MCIKKSPLALAALIAVAVPLKASAVLLYWDQNGTTAGAGTTPSGLWDNSSLFWNTDPTGNGAGLVNWSSTANTAVFSAGSDATGAYSVSISGTQTAAGIVIEDGKVTFSTGVAAVGTGAISVNSGATLSINSSARLSGSAGSKVTLNGGTLAETNTASGSFFIPFTMDLEIGASGGTVSYTNGTAGAFIIYGGTSGTITGTGTLTKTGPGEFRYQGVGLPNTTFSKLVVNQGLFRLGLDQSVQDERGFGAVPATFTPDAITLSGGGGIGTSFNTTLHANRGITLGVGGGVIDGTLGTMTIPGAISGTGSLTILNSAILGTQNTYSGGTVINGGSLTTGTGASGGIVTVTDAGGLGAPTGSLSVNNVRAASGQTVVLNLSTTGPTTVGSLSGTITAPSSGTNTVTINNGGQLFTVNQTTAGSFAGAIAGAGGFTLGDLSTNSLTLTGANTFSGGTTVVAGSLIVTGAAAKLGTGPVTVLSTAVKLTIQTGVVNAITNSATLSLAGGGTTAVADAGYLELGTGINETVGGLVLGGNPQPAGTYGSSLSSAQFKDDEYFLGLGILTVVPEPGTIITLVGGFGVLLGLQRFRRRN